MNNPAPQFLSRLRCRDIPVLVFFFALLLFSVTLRNQFVFDDSTLIVNNPNIMGVRSWPRLFTQGYWPEELGEKLYRPVTMLSYSINRRFLGRLNPSPYHAVNVLLHAMNAALVCALGIRLLGRDRRWAALAAGLFFAAHPVQVDAVAPIYGRAELLAALFYFLALLSWTHSDPNRRWDKQWLAALAFAGLGLLSKESAVTFPAAALLCDWLMGRTTRQNLGALIVRYAGLVVVVVLYLLLRAHALGVLTTAQNFYSQPSLRAPLPVPFTVDTGTRLATALSAFTEYARLLVWPARLSPDYSYAALPVLRSFASPQVWLPALGILALIATGIACARRYRAVAFGIFFALVAFSVVSNLFIPTSAWMAERFLYLPLFGLAVLAGMGFEALLLRERLRAAGVTICAVILAALALRTFVRNQDWRNSTTLWTSAAQAEPQSVVVLHNYGETLLAGGQPGEAEKQFRAALAIAPDMADSHNVLSRALLQQRRFEEAEAEARRALALRGDLASAQENLGLSMMARHDYTGAVEHLRIATTELPSYSDGWNNLGVALFNLESYTEAMDAYQHALDLTPDNANARFNYGAVLLRIGRLRDAAQQFEIAVQRNPGLSIAYLYLAEARGQSGDLVAAENALRAGAQRDPNNPAFPLALAHLYNTTGHTNEAAQAAARAKELQAAGHP